MMSITDYRKVAGKLPGITPDTANTQQLVQWQHVMIAAHT